MKNTILFLALLAGYSTLNAQEKTTKNTPVSIYTLDISKDNNGYTQLNSRLKLTDYSFNFVDDEDVMNENFSVSVDKNKSATFFYDDYFDYQINTYSKKFFDKHDITRWSPQELKLQ